jgi:DNA repair exonuclease SbcCD nuclease subunit
VDLAITESADFLLIAGDLYDGDWKDYNTGLFFTAQMGRLDEAGVPVFVIAGNHDAASQITRRLRPPGNVHLFSTASPQTRVLEHLGVAVHGQGFPRREVTEDLSRAYPPPREAHFNIGLLHTALDGREGHAPYAPASVDGLRARAYDYWALGHVHAREVVCEEPWVVFPGNLQGRNARETGAKGASLVQVRAHRVQAVEHRPLDVVRWFDEPVDCSGAAGVDEVLARVEQSLLAVREAASGRLAALRIRLTGTATVDGRLRSDAERVVNECRALAVSAGDVWVEQVRLETREPADAALALSRDDAFGSLLRAIRDLDADDAALAELGAEFTALRNRLPPDLLGADDGFDPTSAEALREALPDVKALLVSRLMGMDSEP